jgi:hypothetical protein
MFASRFVEQNQSIEGSCPTYQLLGSAFVYSDAPLSLAFKYKQALGVTSDILELYHHATFGMTRQGVYCASVCNSMNNTLALNTS